MAALLAWLLFGTVGLRWRCSSGRLVASAGNADTHVRYLDTPVRRVLSIIPAIYYDVWTAAKGFYKVEPVVADGGQVAVYAPHVQEVAATHPEIYEVGYHCRDYSRWGAGGQRGETCLPPSARSRRSSTTSRMLAAVSVKKPARRVGLGAVASRNPTRSRSCPDVVLPVPLDGASGPDIRPREPQCQ